MDDEQKTWQEQFWKNFGPKEFLRFYFAILSWGIFWIALGAVFDFSSSVIAYIVVITIFMFPVIAHWWKPAYLIYRKILGNEGLPTEPAPHPRANGSSHRLKWWHFIIIGPAILMNLILFYLVIKYALR